MVFEALACLLKVSLAQVVKNLPTMRETWVSILFLGATPGEGNGNPLQYSCLENPMDRGAWWAKVHKVASSQTGLGDLTLSLSACHLLVSQLLSKFLPLAHYLVLDLLACNAVSTAILDSVTNALQYGVGFCCTMTQISHKSTYIPILSLSLSPTPISSLRVVTDHLAELLVLCSKLPNFLLAICFTHGNVCISVLLYHFVPPCLSPTMFISSFSTSAFLFFPCK